MNHLAELKLFMPLLLIVSLYNLHMGYFEKREYEWFREIFTREHTYRFSIQDWIRWNDYSYPRWMLYAYSLSYWYHGPPPGYLTRATVPEWIVECIYGVLYMFPAPRAMKTGPKTGIKMVGWARWKYYDLISISKVKLNLWQFNDWEHFKVCWFTGINAKKRWFKLGLLLLLVVIAIQLSVLLGVPAMLGVSYYASQSLGNDSYDGTAPTFQGGSVGPIQSITRFNYYLTNVLVDDDILYAKQDDTWTLTSYYELYYHGSDGHPKTVDSYYVSSPGAKPIFDGNDVGGHAVYGGNVTWRNIKFKDSGPLDNQSGLSIYGIDTDNVIIEYCESDETRTGRAYFMEGTGSYRYVRFCSGTGVVCGAYGKDDYDYNIDHSYMYGNTVTAASNNGDCLLLHEADGQSPIASYHYAHDNTASGAIEETFDVQSGSYVYIWDNDFGGSDNLSMFCCGDANNIFIYRNHYYEMAAGRGALGINVAHVTVWGNLFVGTSSSAYLTMFYSYPEWTDPQAPSDVKIYKNTYVKNGSGCALRSIEARTPSTTGNIDVYGNIVTQINGSLGRVWDFNNSGFTASDSRLTANNNLYGPNGTVNFSVHDTNGDYTFTQWQALGAGRDTNGYNADPLFMNRTGGDYHIDDTSPAHGMGQIDVPFTNSEDQYYNRSYDNYPNWTAGGAFGGEVDYVDVTSFPIQLSNRVMDYGLTILNTEADRIDICNAQPTTYTQATNTPGTGYSLGSFTVSPGALVGNPFGSENGRAVTVIEIFGNNTYTGTATHWAISDTVNERLLATGVLQTSTEIVSGHGFNTSSFDITIDFSE